MNGQINFSVRPNAKGFFMTRQFNDCIIRMCIRCLLHDNKGVYDMCFGPSGFLYMKCFEQNGIIVRFENVFENYFSHANVTIGISFARLEELPNQMWFYYGKACKTRLKDPLDECQKKAVAIYTSTCCTGKKSIDMLCLCLLRLLIYKDLRQFIVKMIWPNEIICWLEE